MAEWLLQLGATVTGFSLPPPTEPALFDQLSLGARLNHLIGDVRDLHAVRQAIGEACPDYVFHLAAQPLVRLSYAHPVETYATNVMGTVNLLEAVRLAGRSCVVVAVTTDKCYENREQAYRYNENDPLGGHDPYSSSKGAAELVISAYRRSYFSLPDSLVRLASGRAGNVVGGGDWALDRLVPDCVRSLQQGKPVLVRNKLATRPWQHVLEPLSGYLWLGACLARDGGPSQVSNLASAFNFGPTPASNRMVADVVQEILKHWPGSWKDTSDPRTVHEAKWLDLSIDKAGKLLKWKPAWSFEQAIAQTVSWYRQASASGPEETAGLTRRQIADYTAAAGKEGVAWSL